MHETLSALEAWLDVLEAAGDDPDRLEAAGAPPVRPASSAGPGRWSPSDRARGNALGERMVALEVRLQARRAEVGRELAQMKPAAPPQSAAPVYFDHRA